MLSYSEIKSVKVKEIKKKTVLREKQQANDLTEICIAGYDI